ncbi:MAG: DNA internalization-related competence protein ComEC/Rec2 [Bacteroidetes bacterium]|nr:DNA internalization-related competence protein ComEC/Rec2 [Bacteroidota bacterium]
MAGSFTLATAEKERKVNTLKASEPIQLYSWEELKIEGVVEAAGVSSSGRELYEVRISKTELPEGVTWNQKIRIRLYAGESLRHGIRAGSRIRGEVRLYQFPEVRNPHEFDYGSWLQSNGFSTHGELTRVVEVEQREELSWAKLRESVLNNVDQLFSEQNAAFAKALFLGYKQELSREQKKKFSRAGLSHIMAVSGLHVGFVVAPFWFLIPYLRGSRKGKLAGIAIITVLLVSYAGITGFSPSVSRASLMAWLLTYGNLFHKVRNSINLTGTAAIILLLIQPSQLFEIGFQLSFGAVFIILMVMPATMGLVPNRYRYGKAGGLMGVIMVSMVVQIGLFPILVSYFREFSIAGPISNAMVIPLLSVLVPTGLALVLIFPLLQNVLLTVVQPLEWALTWIQGVAKTLGGSAFGFITIAEIYSIIFLIWLFALFAIAGMRYPHLRWKMVIALLLSLNILVVQSLTDRLKPKELEITMLDVGQGDAVHIKTPNNKHILVDTGRWTPNGNSGESIILPYLESRGIRKLDALILSHPHADHIGGTLEILQSIPVDTIYQSSYSYDSVLYQSISRLTKSKGIPVVEPMTGDRIDIDPAIRLFVLAPEPGAADPGANNRSVIFRLVYGKTSALFTGDAEIEQERRLVRRYGDFIDSDFYKVGHHGSHTSSTEELLRQLTPQISIASLSLNNRFGHPRPEAVRRIDKYSKAEHYTSVDGAIRYASDGERFRQIEWR